MVASGLACKRRVVSLHYCGEPVQRAHAEHSGRRHMIAFERVSKRACGPAPNVLPLVLLLSIVRARASSSARPMSSLPPLRKVFRASRSWPAHTTGT